MDIDNFFKTEPIKEKVMSQKEYFEKTKEILIRIDNCYACGFQWRSLKDGEYPDESVCDKCDGNGEFMDNNGERKECVQDKEYGECFHRFCDHEQVVSDLETILEDMYEILSVDKLKEDI